MEGYMKRLFFTTIFVFGICYINSEAQESKQFMLYEDFESIIPPLIPAGWIVVDANGDGRTWQTRKFGGHSTSPQCFKYSSDAITVANDWFFSTSVQLQVGIPYTLTFRYKVSKGAVHKMNAWIGNSPSPAGMTTQIFSNPSLSDSLITEISTDFTPPVSGIYHLGFHCFSDADNGYLNVDDILLSKFMNDMTIKVRLTESYLNPGPTPAYLPTDTIECAAIIENTSGSSLFLNQRFVVGNIDDRKIEVSFIVMGPLGDTLTYIAKYGKIGKPDLEDFEPLMSNDKTGKIYDLQKGYIFSQPGTYTIRAKYHNYYKCPDGTDTWLGVLISLPETFIIQ